MKLTLWVATFTGVINVALCAMVSGAQSTPQHIIGVQTVNGVSQFYRRDTGQTFVPRGNSFIRLANQNLVFGGTALYHSMFNVGLYDPSDVETQLTQMQADGYNLVRVFMNGAGVQGIGNPDGGLSSAYLANVVDFLQRAKSHELFVYIEDAPLPQAGGYYNLLPTIPTIGGVNLYFLTSGGIAALSKYSADLVTGLAALNAPLDFIFGWDLYNELYFDGSSPPFTLASGNITTANGMTYDMSDPAAVQARMNDNLVYFINQARSAVLNVDPTALATVSFFVPQGPNPARAGDTRLINTQPAICCSNMDFIDLHPYPGTGLTLPQFVQKFGLQAVNVKPVVMGEYGALQDVYDSPNASAPILQQWQVQSCPLGFNGWLLWNWDVDIQPDANYWSALSGGGGIDQALRPLMRPDPCQGGAYLGQDLAIGSVANASASIVGSGPEMAIDGLTSTSWNSGGAAPQWIEIDLPAPSIVSGVQLIVAQSPSGPTVHDLYLQTEGSSQPQLVNEFSGTTQDQQVLTWTAATPMVGVSSIRVVTVSSPSSVAWRQIEILSGESGQPAITSVVNGASFDPAITPGSWVTIQGTDLAASARTWQPSDFNGSRLPTMLDGVSVSIDGAPAAVYYISPTQLNVQAPSAIHTGQAVAVTVVRDNVQINASAQANSKIDDPALFTYNASGSTYVAAVFPDGTVVGDPTKTPATRGASSGDSISLYGTGFGVSPSGVVITSPTTLSSTVQVMIGGQPTTVQYAGLVGVGLCQINIVVPNLPAGDFPVAVQFRGATAPTLPSIPIRQ